MARTIKFIVSVAMLVAAIGLATDDAGAGTPAITATPNSNLVHGQTVTVDGTGFEPGVFAEAVQCQAGADGPEDCDYAASASSTTTGAGAFSVSFPVKVIIATAGGPVDCRTPGACIIGGGTSFDDVANTPIEFDPNGPAPLAPVLTVSPNTDLVDGEEVRVSGTGFEPDRPAFIVECSGTFVHPAFCDGDHGLSFRTDGDGAFDQAFMVRAQMQIRFRTFDCRQSPCFVVASTGTEVAVPISFRPEVAPVATQPTFTG